MNKTPGSRSSVRGALSFLCLLCAVTVALSGHRAVLTAGSSTPGVYVVEDLSLVDSFGIPFGPRGVAVTADGSILYASSGYGGSLTRIDIEAHQVVATLPTGDLALDIAMNAAETRIYVANRDSHTVSFVDTESFTVLLNAPAGPYPRSVTLGPDEETIFVAQNGLDEPDRVSKLSTMDGTVIDSIEFGQGWPGRMVLSPDGSQLYVGLESASSIAIVDLDTFTVAETFPLSHKPAAMVFHPSGFPLYVSSWFDDAVLAVHPQTLEVLATHENLPTPAGTDITPDGTLLYVHMGSNFDAFVLDAGTLDLVRKVDVTGNSRGWGKFIVAWPPDDVPATSRATLLILIVAMLALPALWHRRRSLR